MEYVVWGAGERGERLFHHLDANHVKAFIDMDENKIGGEYCGKKVISFEEYKEKYYYCYIVISIMHENEVVEVLERSGINCYFLLSECPGEFQESNPRDILRKYVLNYLVDEKKYVIYGCTLYSLLLAEWIEHKLGIQVNIIPHSGTNRDLVEGLKHEFKLCLLEELDIEVIDEILVTVEPDINRVKNYAKGKTTVTNIYDCSDQIEEYYNPQIEKFKNRHDGKRGFIVATGPSLRIEDLNKLAAYKEICISFNSIWRAFQDTEWRPQYYIAIDYKVIRDYKDIMEKQDIEYYFWGDNYRDFRIPNCSQKHFQHHFVNEHFERRCPKFSEDFARKSYLGYTVTYNSMQLAAYMGFKEIYLLGVDFSYGGKGKDSQYDHFYQEEKLVSIGYERQVYLAYLSAKKYAEEHGIKIYNATRGGKLEIFERVDFDSLF